MMAVDPRFDEAWSELNLALDGQDYRKAEGFITQLGQYRESGLLPAGFEGTGDEFDQHLRDLAREVAGKLHPTAATGATGPEA